MTFPTPTRVLVLAGSIAISGMSIAADRDSGRAQPGDAFAWTTSFEGTRSSLCNAIANTKAGAVIAGQFAGELKSGQRTRLQNSGRNDGFVASLSDSGKVLWQVAVGGEGNDQLRAIEIDSDGNIYATGFVSGAAKDDSQIIPASAAGPDAYLLKLSPNGKTLWTRRLAGPFADAGTALAIAGDGTVFWGGHFQKEARLLEYADMPAIVSDGGVDVFVAAFDPQGKPKWLRSFGGKQADELVDLAADGHGNVVVAGSYESLFPLRREKGVDFLRSKGGTDAFLMRLDGQGALDWAKSISGPQQEYPVAISINGDQILLAGNFQSRLNVDPKTTLQSAGVFDGFIGAWSMQGNLAWARRFGGAQAVTVQAMHAGHDQIDVVGSFQGKLDFGSDAGIADIESASVTPFVATINDEGRWMGAREGAAGANADFLAATTSAEGNLLVCGISKGEFGNDDERREEEPRDSRADSLAERDTDKSEESEVTRERDRDGDGDSSAAEQEEEEKERSVAFVAKLRK